MQGTGAQIITLVLHGNAFLQRGQLAIDFFPNNSAFSFCEYVKFVEPHKSEKREQEFFYANDPAAWLQKLKAQGVYSLRLIYISSNNQNLSDRMSVGFIGGGGRWLIEALAPSCVDYWEARWEVGNQDHPQKLIWQVAYGKIARTKNHVDLNIREPAVVKNDLIAILGGIEKFANQHKLDGFAKAFHGGLILLNSAQPYSDAHHKDVSPSNFLSLEARQLLAASQSAWVFGGMGSWNDLGFDGDEQKTYELLSDSLYNLLNEAYLVAVNSIAPHPREFISKPSNKPWWAFWR